MEPKLAAIYLPGADIDGSPITPATRAFLGREIARARAGREALWIVADSGRAGAAGGWALIDPAAHPGRRDSRAEAMAPSVIARLGLPVARDLAAPPDFGSFLPGALETGTVTSYGDRRSASGPEPTETGREYLEKLKSLGYLQ